MWAILGSKGGNHGLVDASGQLGFFFILIYNDFLKLWVCRYVLWTPLQKFDKTLTGWMVDGTLQHFSFCPELYPSITADRPVWIPAWGPDSLPDKEPP